jgi:hypothetical protein
MPDPEMIHPDDKPAGSDWGDVHAQVEVGAKDALAGRSEEERKRIGAEASEELSGDLRDYLSGEGHQESETAREAGDAALGSAGVEDPANEDDVDRIDSSLVPQISRSMRDHEELDELFDSPKDNGDNTRRSAGEAALEPAAEQDILKGEAGNDNSETQKWREENWEHDEKRAESMAQESDKASYRELAAEVRLGSEYAKYEKRSAEELDSMAQRVEKWAAILHDNPVTNEYEKDHDSVRFTGRGLAGAEEWLSHLKDKDQNGIGFYERPDWGSKTLPKLLHAPDDVRFNGGEPDEAITQLLDRGTTTIDDLRKYFIEQRQKENKATIEELTTILDDVKTGRAAEYTGKKDSEG